MKAPWASEVVHHRNALAAPPEAAYAATGSGVSLANYAKAVASLRNVPGYAERVVAPESKILALNFSNHPDSRNSWVVMLKSPNMQNGSCNISFIIKIWPNIINYC